ncbi:rhodanese-like domain-containing protein [Thermus thermamylovorans]|uniref:Rhodanese-like domain-containing protein n=1 Tax=Thermus thermamylovorans TaxID=2509362 RepID=A0A4Q9B922_9DEIN|nr:rhodanese-like domain-containing protein [Thermus thermamylovorans]TBH21418.1 rhodanese-like domain-containing protein [Thermus thermamylovorans]
MKGYRFAWLGLLLVLPVLAQATTATFSAMTVREVGNFLSTLPAGFYAMAPAVAKQQMDAMDVFLLDVREPSEFQAERIQGAVNIPIRDLPRRIGEVPKGKPVIVYCKVGHRGAMATVFLRGQGYNVQSISGGLDAWKAAGLPVVR